MEGLGSRRLFPAAVLLVAVASCFAVIINTWKGVRAVKPIWIRAAESMGARDRQLFRLVILPAALPMILTGMRIGLGVAWMTIIAAELVGTQSGLGYMISEARFNLDIESIVVGMLVIGLLGLLSDRCLRWLQATLVPWHAKT